MKRLLFASAALLLTACPPASPPNTPPTDASDATTVVVVVTDGAPVSFEQHICNALAEGGCKAGAAPGCAASLSANKIPGGYATEWAACLYEGAEPTSCGVPCGN